jgi:hypothetical protein
MYKSRIIQENTMSTADELLTPELMKKARDLAAAVEDPTLAAGSQSEAEGRVAAGSQSEAEGRVAGVDVDAGAGAGALLSPKQNAINKATDELEQLKARVPPASPEELEAAEGRLAAANAMEGGRRRRSRRRHPKKGSRKSKKGGARKSKKVGRSRKNGSKRRAHRKH